MGYPRASNGSNFNDSDERMMETARRDLREAEVIIECQTELSDERSEAVRVRISRCKQVLMDLGYLKAKGNS